MEWNVDLGFTNVTIRKELLGQDILLIVTGGAAHIGCAVLSVPRPSLFDPDRWSCTSSVLNVTGHKDETICRMLAESVSVKYRQNVICTGGIHIDRICPEQISKIIEAVQTVCAQI